MAKDGDYVENEIICTCGVHSGRSANYCIETPYEKKLDIVARGVADTLKIMLFSGLVTSFLSKPVHSPKKILLAHDATLLMLREQPSKPFEPRNDEIEVNEVYKSGQEK